MTVPRYIWIKNQRYYLYDGYDSWRDAYNVARLQKRRSKSKYYILQIEAGTLFPRMRYYLYLTRVIGLW